MLTDLLTHEGYSVDVAESAPEAMRLILMNQYSLLITDNEMPIMSGVELAEEIRGRGFRLPILVISSDLNPTQEAIIMNLGLSVFLPKPFGISEVRDAVARLFAAAEDDTPKPRWYAVD